MKYWPVKPLYLSAGTNELYVNDNPMGPPRVDTIGEGKLRFTFPFAKFTVTGPAESVGAGPLVPIRWLTEKWVIQLGSTAPSNPSSVITLTVYAPPS